MPPRLRLVCSTIEGDERDVSVWKLCFRGCVLTGVKFDADRCRACISLRNHVHEELKVTGGCDRGQRSRDTGIAGYLESVIAVEQTTPPTGEVLGRYRNAVSGACLKHRRQSLIPEMRHQWGGYVEGIHSFHDAFESVRFVITLFEVGQRTRMIESCLLYTSPSPRDS